MSWDEYSNMFEKAQETGKYKCYVFDMKDSKKGYDRKNLFVLLRCFKTMLDISIPLVNKMYQEVPCIVQGDIILLLTLRDSISDEKVYKIFRKAKEQSGINKEFHFISGYYETDDWVKGLELYYLGYCIQELEYRAKKKKELI